MAPAWQRVIAERPDPPPGPSAPCLDLPEDRLQDPREEAEWFRRLPPEAREEMREAWRIQEGTGRGQKRRRKATTKLYVVEAGVCFALLELCMQASRTTLALALLSGAAAGAACAVTRATALLCGALFLVAFLLFGGAAGSMPFVHYALASPLVLCLGVAAGRIHQLQRFDGSEL